jgi:hypothetical protein
MQYNYCYYHHFTIGETEAQEVRIACPRSQSYKGASRIEDIHRMYILLSGIKYEQPCNSTKVKNKTVPSNSATSNPWQE